MISRIRKIASYCLLVILLAIVSYIGILVHCANGNKMYNVVVEGVDKYGGNYVGSGVLISEDGLVLTAGHCVDGAIRLRITLSDGRVFDVNERSCYKDPNSDTGLIKLPAVIKNYIKLSDSNDAKSGDIIYNIGNASGIWDNSVFYGRVYKNHYRRMFLGENTEHIFAKMTVIGGCSGGGVYHWNNLIGIVSRGGPGVTLIVPSNICYKVMIDFRWKLIRNCQNAIQ